MTVRDFYDFYVPGKFTGAPVLALTSDRGVQIYRRDVVQVVTRGPQPPPSHLFSVTLGVPCTDAPIAFAPEAEVDRKLEAIGIVGRVKLGDAAFDDAVKIDTEARVETVQALLTSATARTELRVLLGMTGGLRIEGSTITVSVGAWQVADPARVAALFDALLGFAASLSNRDAFPYREGAPARLPIAATKRKLLPRAALALSVLVGAGAAGAYLLLVDVAPPMVPDRLSLVGQCLGAGAWLVASAVAVLALRGRVRSPRDIAVASTALLMLIPLGGVAAASANAVLPSSGGIVRHPARLVERRARKGGTYLAVTTPSGEDVRLPRHVVFHGDGPGEIIVESRVGAFGVEYVTGVVSASSRPAP